MIPDMMIFGIIWQCLPFLGEWGTIYQRSIKYKKYARQMQCNDRQQQWQEEEATRDTGCQPPDAAAAAAHRAATTKEPS